MPSARRSALLLACLALPLLGWSRAWAGYEWQGSVDSLIAAVIQQGRSTLGQRVNAPPVVLRWCRGTYYVPGSRTICFSRSFIDSLATKLGDAAVAYVAAHEYAHHLQASLPGFLQRARGNVLRIELQADCFAGIILGRRGRISLDSQDIKEMLAAAVLLGDQEYDSRNHHGDGENRALALRSGLRYGASGKRDNYFDLFCRIN